MALDTPQLPIRISKVTDRYLLFDIDDVMYLRRNHGICSPFVGTMPQAQQQNVFLGLPIELMAEEAKVLVEKKVAYVVDDSVFHPSKIASIDGPTKAAYLQTLARDGKSAAMAARELSESKRAAQAEHIKTKSKKGKKQSSKDLLVAKDGSEDPAVTTSTPENTEETSLFDSPGGSIPKRAPPPAQTLEAWPITSTTSGAMLDSPPEDEDTSYLVDAPPGYPLYAHLQDKGYYMMPGLRFGCDYNVYPGDPLRFHSHFQATHYGWNEEINLLDLITGGRLGTNVKKAYLIGGEVPSKDVDGKVKEAEKAPKTAGPSTSSVLPPVRAFSIEWAAM